MGLEQWRSQRRTSVDEAIPVRVDKIKRRRRQQGNDFLGPDFQHGVLF